MCMTHRVGGSGIAVAVVTARRLAGALLEDSVGPQDAQIPSAAEYAWNRV